MYYEVFRFVTDAIRGEKEIKGWGRSKKLELIKLSNPEMKFLNNDLI